MEFDISYELESADQFWLELDDILSAPCPSHESIDNCLRTYLAFATKFKDVYLRSNTEMEQYALKLTNSHIFTQQQEYVRRQFTYCLLQEDDPATLHVAVAILLIDGLENEETLELMHQESVFPRLVELIPQLSLNEHYDSGLHKLLLDLMYAISRIHRLDWHDLKAINDTFVLSLFSLIEAISSDVTDPYHYCVIKVLLVLNEQYMVASAMPPPEDQQGKRGGVTNRVLKVLSQHASVYKTFGENIILLLNRETETSQQLLILKLLYLIFGTPSTAEYFYTNDLHVLLDVILRNLLDLPADELAGTQALRHTYLRVLHLLLENSQLSKPGAAYKRPETLAVLDILRGANSFHFAPADDTTIRLTERCRAVSWLEAPPSPPTINAPAAGINGGSSVGSASSAHPAIAAAAAAAAVPKKNGRLQPPVPPPARRDAARRKLGMSLQAADESTLSVAAIAEQHAKPGVVTPSRGLNRRRLGATD